MYFLSMSVFMFLFRVCPLSIFVSSPYTSHFYSISVILACTIYLPIMSLYLPSPYIPLCICSHSLYMFPFSVCVLTLYVLFRVCLYSMCVPSLCKSYIPFPYISTSRVCLHSICPLSVCIPILCLFLLRICLFHVYPHSMCVLSPCKSYIPFPCVSRLHV